MAGNIFLRSFRLPLKNCTQVTHSRLALVPSQIYSMKHVGIHHTSLNSQENDSQLPSSNKFEISFEEYQKLKRSLKTKQRVAGIPFAFVGMASASLVTAYLYPDMFDATPENVQLILGLDPLVFSGVSGVASAGVGYIIGTSVFKLLWRTMNKQEANSLLDRDLDFLKRLDKYRFGGDSKFEDDYYGETIKTLSDYRQWVRTHQRKRENHLKYKMKSEEESKDKGKAYEIS